MNNELQIPRPNRELSDRDDNSSALRQHQPGGGRKEIIELINRYSREMMLSADSVLVTSVQVLKYLHELGHLKHARRSNGIGDVLGIKHFNLPYSKRNGRRRYLIPATSWSAEDKEAFLALAPSDITAKMWSLEDDLLGVDHNSVDQSEGDQTPSSAVPNPVEIKADGSQIATDDSDDSDDTEAVGSGI